MEFGSSLLELPGFGRRDGNQVVMQAPLLVSLQDQAALLRDEGLAGEVGDGGDIAQTAAVIRNSSRSQLKICKQVEISEKF